MHCLHTHTQLLTDSDVLSSRGEIFFKILFYLFIVIIIIIVIPHYCVLSFKSLTILSLQEKNLYI